MMIVVNFLTGLILGFLLCAWALETPPLVAFDQATSHIQSLFNGALDNGVLEGER